MDTQLIITFVILIVSIILFATDKLPADLIALLVVVALGVSGVLTPQEAFSGFSRSPVITIMAIFILAEALRRSGVTARVGNILLKIGGRSESRLIVVVMITAAFLSLFMNNIAAAAVLLPAVSGAAKKAGMSLSRLMMPLAFGTILGGMATLLTTSNIVLGSLLRDNGIQGFSLVDFAPVGIPLVIAGIAYVAIFGKRFLPGESIIERTQTPVQATPDDLITAYHLGENLFRARVPDSSFLSGKTLAECTLREDFGVSVVAIERKGKQLFAIAPDTVIKHGDTLVLEGDERDFRSRDVEPFMEFLPSRQWSEQDLESRAVEVVEVMLAPRSRLTDQTLRSSRFREKYGMSVLAIWRGDQEIITDLADINLQLGDALLLQGAREKISLLREDADLILLMQKEGESITVPNKGRVAMMIVIGTLIIAVMLPDLTAAIMLGGALAMMLTGILTMEQAYAAIGWKSVFLVAGILPLGVALTKTNAAGMMANEIVYFIGPLGALALLAGLFVLTTLLTQAINGAAVAAIVGPIAIDAAHRTGANPRSFMMGVALATSMAFMTPLGHPVNVLVMGPGGYNFRDYFKVGFPLTVLLFLLIMIILPLVWTL